MRWGRTDCGDGGDDFTELELVQDGRLARCVETNHQDAHLLLAPEAIEQLRERETHGSGCVVGKDAGRDVNVVGCRRLPERLRSAVHARDESREFFIGVG